MNHLATITDQDFFPEKIASDRNTFKLREAARAVVFDKDNNAGLIFTPHYNVHKLPGGAIEKGETPNEACVRECKEELGCDVEITQSLGCIEEYKARRKEHQRSYFFLARVVGEKGIPQFTQFERAGKFSILWTTLPDAIHRSRSDKPTDYDGRFIQRRELFILTLLTQNP